MKKLLSFLLYLFCATSLAAQTDLFLDGQLVARDVSRTGRMPEALQQLLQGREMSLRQASQNRFMRSMTSSRIGPLLASIRDQEEPYNLLCPIWLNDDGTPSTNRCLSGCVATAIEQVMAFYRYPEALIDTLHGWKTDHVVLEDMLPGTRFDWDNYLLDYRNGWTYEQGYAIALPTLAAGLAVHMSYGPHSSGASVSKGVEPLQRALGYGMVRYFERILYTPERWHAMLRHELEHGRPIVYAGHTMTMAGHAFNIDGVDGSGFYHVNWGYNGDYDGWYDLDRLSPWEPVDMGSDGLLNGFYSNQSALFMHPSTAAKPLEPDSMKLEDLKIVLEAIDLERVPDVQGYIGADFHFRNDGEEAVTYTYEIMTWLPEETDIFKKADYVGLSALTLQPGEHRTQRVWLRFSAAGDRLLGISHDDVTIPYQQLVHIEEGTRSKLVWGEAQIDDYRENVDGTYDYDFSVSVRNDASSGYAGDDITICLFPDNSTEDLRHYRVLSLAAGRDTTLHVTFTGLMPQIHYMLYVRCPWPIQASVDFTTPVATGIVALPQDDDKALRADGARWPSDSYDLTGRRVHKPSRGVIIHHGKKIWLNN
ncbi:MAG: C10 family peptidase [Bacteroidaceae bacterium]|nr:C10 family peptidase [Bacteroidaceae bacterium]